MIDRKAFDQAALELAEQDGAGLGTKLAKQFGVSRAYASQRLRSLVRRGLLVAEGNTRARRYRLAVLQHVGACYKTEGLSEDLVWQELCRQVVDDFPENVRDIWHYGITEMVNNVIDHSGSPSVTVELKRTALHTTCDVFDTGEGIFNKIQRALNLYDPREAIVELAKGKFTTDPEHHTGEGIFFSSKVFDCFEIVSGKVAFLAGAVCRHDVIIDLDDEPVAGTLVQMRLRNDSERTLKQIMDEYAAPEAFTFSKTVIPIRLAVHEGEKLVSRSQAKRITHRIERFENVVLDFEGVNEIGQAFADQIFRVFKKSHPKTLLIPINTNDQVRQMIERVVAAEDSGEDSG